MVRKAYSILEEIFTNQISVLNIAVPTAPLDLQSAKKECDENNYDVHLVQEIEFEDLQVFIRKKNSIRPIHDSEVISESTPILEVLEVLCEKEQIFVKVKRNITHLVTRSDLDTIPVRIWLYGMISLFEIELKEAINNFGIEWQNLLSENRINKTTELFELKIKNNEEIDLLGCTMLADIGTIISKSWGNFITFFPPELSKNNIITSFNKINQLRDALAHGQKLQMDWSKVYHLAKLISYTLKKL
ncbi:MAG: hypothetical protein R6X28_13480 [Bacteroidales bacterium]